MTDNVLILTDAEMLALAVLKGQENAALLLADEVMAQHHQGSKYRRRDELEEELMNLKLTLAYSMLEGPQTLPVPRLELVCEPVTDYPRYDYAWIYRLIIRHLQGFHVTIPLGYTGCNGEMPTDASQEYGPFRDGAHIRHDMKHLNLPAFIVIGEHSVYQIQEG